MRDSRGKENYRDTGSSSETGRSVPSPLTSEELLRLVHPQDPVVSRDGSLIAFTVNPSSTEKGKGVAGRLWIGSPPDQPRQATRGPGSDSLPVFSPVDDRLAFASDREHPGQLSLQLLEPQQGEAAPMGEVPGTVEQIRWTRDGSALVVLAADLGADAASTNGAVKLLTEGFPEPDPLVVRPRQTWRRLYRVDASTGETREVGTPDVNVWEFDLLSAEMAVAVVSDDPSEGGWYRSWLALLDLETRSARRLYDSDWQVACPAADGDGHRVAFVEGWASDRGQVAGTLRVLDIDSQRFHSIELDVTDVTWASWAGPSDLWIAGWRGLGSIWGRVPLEGKPWMRVDDATIGASFQARIGPSSDGSYIAAAYQTDSIPPEVALLDVSSPDSDWAPWSGLNTDLISSSPDLPVLEPMTWTSDDGVALEGILALPANRSGPLPLVVDVHGGPSFSWKHSFNPGHSRLLAAAGYSVLLPNPRGSSGRGQDFARLNLGDPMGKEFGDILAGVDECVRAGFAVPDRVGVMGASYGGYTSAWAAAASDRFRCAVVISGMTNLVSCRQTCNIPPFYDRLLGMTLYDVGAIERMMERSPIAHVLPSSAPTLLIQGREDLCVPHEQSEEFYQTLVDNGVEVELVLYPREGHGLRERDHILDAWGRIVAWFDRHLKNLAV
jgi:dipeptidyl aminopeptidase/acylaminoacyl peptidase